MDVKSIIGVAEENVVEVKNNNVEKSEELASEYVDKQQSQSPIALKNKLTTQFHLQLPTIAVQTKKHHEESKITTLMDLTRDDAQTT